MSDIFEGSVGGCSTSVGVRARVRVDFRRKVFDMTRGSPPGVGFEGLGWIFPTSIL